MPETASKLTQLSRRGGSASKLAPELLRQVLAGITPGLLPPQLLAGMGAADAAVVYQLNAQQAIVVTTDFFTPQVDDPLDFGRSAASHALSAVYAMGGTPLFALAVAGMPSGILAPATMTQIFEGGTSVCRAAGIPIVGGHTIDAPEPIYGLVAIGLVNPQHLKRNAEAQAGDRLILGKPLGSGCYSQVLRQGQLSDNDYEALLQNMVQLNTPGPVLACLDGVHALSDIGGGGLLGHLLDLCRGCGLRARLDFAAVPLLHRCVEFVRAGHVSDVVAHNWASYGAAVNLAGSDVELLRPLLADPQTSGGLLVACAPDTVTEVLSIFLQQGFAQVSVIGELGDGEPGIDVL